MPLEIDKRRSNMVAFRAVTRSTNLSLVNTLDVRQQIALLAERATKFETECCSPTHVNAANVSVAMCRVTEAFATVRARESLFFVVNGTNVSVE